MSEPLIIAENVSKKFCRDLKHTLWYGVKDLGREVFMPRRMARDLLRDDEFLAVRGVSFKVNRGECLGLIGPNGAGKSSLLKMLCGLIKPDHGCITMKGRTSALIELGAGFNPILTGRENIYINGAVLGFPKKMMDKEFDAIVDFAELSTFIDTPVQYYSSGMKVRLGFSIAIRLKPDILLIDEVLAVGDPAFRLKCLNAMDHLLADTAMIFVSHSMPMISRICTDIMLLNKGETRYYDTDVARGIDLYYNSFAHQEPVSVVQNSNVVITGCQVMAPERQGNIPVVKWLADLTISTTISIKFPWSNLNISFILFDKEQRPVGSVSSGRKGLMDNSLHQPDSLVATVTIPGIQLSKGVYTIDVVVTEDFKHKPLCRLKSACAFQITDEVDVRTPMRFNGQWVFR